jgi:hypothetical protein
MRIPKGAEGRDRWRTSRLHGGAEEGVKLVGMALADVRSRGVEGGGVVDRRWRDRGSGGRREKLRMGAVEGRGEPIQLGGVRGNAGDVSAGSVRLDPQGLLLPDVAQAASLGRGWRGWRRNFVGRGGGDEFEGLVFALGEFLPKMEGGQSHGGRWAVGGRWHWGSEGRVLCDCRGWAGGQHGAHGDMSSIVVDNKG